MACTVNTSSNTGGENYGTQWTICGTMHYIYNRNINKMSTSLTYRENDVYTKNVQVVAKWHNKH